MHEKFLRMAVDLATHNVTHNNGGPFGGVITKNDTVIATGVNEVTRTNDPTAHAEIVAIRAACKKLNSFQLEGCIIYSSCEPCPMCLGAIYWARPHAVYFASSRHDAASIHFDDSFIYEQLALSIEKRSIAMQQSAIENHMAPFTAWTDQQKKVTY